MFYFYCQKTSIVNVMFIAELLLLVTTTQCSNEEHTIIFTVHNFIKYFNVTEFIQVKIISQSL